MDFSLIDAEGFSSDCMGASSRAGLSSGTLTPGQTVKGYLAAELPAASTPAQVEFATWLPTAKDDWIATWR